MKREIGGVRVNYHIFNQGGTSKLAEKNNIRSLKDELSAKPT